jgi:hypothetical protein
MKQALAISSGHGTPDLGAGWPSLSFYIRSRSSICTT